MVSAVLLVAVHSSVTASTTTAPYWSEWRDLATTPAGDGYWLAQESGRVAAFGAAEHHGDRFELPHEPMIGIAAAPDGKGYWLAAADGGVFTFGTARFYGSAAELPLVAPVVAIEPTPTGRGYWLLASDGGVFGFGDAPFLGRVANEEAEAVALAASPSGSGYFITYSNFGPFAFGDAVSDGQLVTPHGDEILVDVESTRSGRGAWLADFRGTVYAGTTAGVSHYGDADHIDLQGRITAMTRTPSGNGYWLLGSDGGVFTFGDARFFGSRP
ncbi:MAG: hypothetical protein WD232_04245 [Acidimicrobiales bacterium]